MKNFFSALVGILAMVAFFGGITAMMFYPRTTEGVVKRHDHNGNASSDRTVVTFQDGRTLRLQGISNIDIEPGKKYRITYNGIDYLYKVEEID